MDAALNAVREAVASGMDWRDLARMIKVGWGAGRQVDERGTVVGAGGVLWRRVVRATCLCGLLVPGTAAK